MRSRRKFYTRRMGHLPFRCAKTDSASVRPYAACRRFGRCEMEARLSLSPKGFRSRLPTPRVRAAPSEIRTLPDSHCRFSDVLPASAFTLVRVPKDCFLLLSPWSAEVTIAIALGG